MMARVRGLLVLPASSRPADGDLKPAWFYIPGWRRRWWFHRASAPTVSRSLFTGGVCFILFSMPAMVSAVIDLPD